MALNLTVVDRLQKRGASRDMPEGSPSSPGGAEAETAPVGATRARQDGVEPRLGGGDDDVVAGQLKFQSLSPRRHCLRAKASFNSSGFSGCGGLRQPGRQSKRLRYFVHRNPSLVGELCRILTKTLTRFHRRRASGPGENSERDCAPAQLIFVQRFGSKVNLHIHFHAVLSDGVFVMREGRLVFEPATAPEPEEIQRITEGLRKRILRRFLKLGAIPQETADEIMDREHSGFSLHANTCVAAQDRDGLKRLLAYCSRPAIYLRRLHYLPEKERVRYRPCKSQPGEPEIVQWHPLEFLSRFAKIIPPPWLNLVRYAGALGPRSALRPLITQAAKQAVDCERLRKGWRPPRLKAPAWTKDMSLKISSAAGRAWASCLRKVFEACPIVCVCGNTMALSAVLFEDNALVKILTHLGLPAGFPLLKPARSPPSYPNEESQMERDVERWYGISDP